MGTKLQVNYLNMRRLEIAVLKNLLVTLLNKLTMRILVEPIVEGNVYEINQINSNRRHNGDHCWVQ